MARQELEAMRAALVAARRARGHSQEDAARECNVSVSGWQKWEAGTTKPTGLYVRALDYYIRKAQREGE